MPNEKTNNPSLYEFFRNTLDHCGLFLLHLSDEDIAWYLFEEFDTDCISFLHENILNQLCAAGKITQDTANMSLVLSRKFRALENTEVWNIGAVRTDPLWREIFILSDEIKKKLQA